MKRAGVIFASLLIGLVLARATSNALIYITEPPEIRNYQPGKPIPWTRPLPMSVAKSIVDEIARRQRQADIQAAVPPGLGNYVLGLAADTVAFLIDPINLLLTAFFAWAAYFTFGRIFRATT
jgi:hypothetical protein